MTAGAARAAAAIGRALARGYAGSAHVREAVPVPPPAAFPAGAGHLERLHAFAGANPIYGGSYRARLAGADCAVYEGDANRLWLGSIGHAASRAPFSPTWLISAYVLAAAARGMGCREAVDVGSGDGRVAYCASLLGMEAHSIELDGALADLQDAVSSATGAALGTRRADAAAFDYASLGLGAPAFFVGGLAQMGGEELADAVVRGMGGALRRGDVMVLAGTDSPKYPGAGGRLAGWEGFMRRHRLGLAARLDLPAAWSLGEPGGTPYLFAVPADRKPH